VIEQREDGPRIFIKESGGRNDYDPARSDQR
jgi:hypothetical protein